MIEQIQKETCKKVTTYAGGTEEPNGHLVELYKDGDKTVVYLTVALPGAFKGFHLHNERQSHYVCLRGKAKITVVEGKQKVEHILDASVPERLLLPTKVYIGIENIGTEEVWLINFPHPSYDPTLKGEQEDKTPAEIEEQLK
ncbi:MAG: WxcM-like domain-containing protein [Candidatus Paceibacterota bacterium]|jgi:dTDP-4-dehydrorhamnose 3,5-epimerase-like enzyme